MPSLISTPVIRRRAFTAKAIGRHLGDCHVLVARNGRRSCTLVSVHRQALTRASRSPRLSSVPRRQAAAMASPLTSRATAGATLTLSCARSHLHRRNPLITPRGGRAPGDPAQGLGAVLVSGRVIVSPTSVDGQWPDFRGALVDPIWAAVKARPGTLKPSLVWKSGPRDSL